MSGKRWLVLLAGAFAIAVLVPTAGSKTKPTRNPATVVDTVAVGEEIHSGVLSVSLDSAPAMQTLSRSRVVAPAYTNVFGAAQVKRAIGAATGRTSATQFRTAALPVLGEVRNWLSLDDTYGTYFRKGFTLRGIGQHVEVWVASELNRRAPNITALPEVGRSDATQFMNTDCRNGPRTVITDAQVSYLIGQFDTNIWPKEAQAFSVAPNRDGSNNLLEDVLRPARDRRPSIRAVTVPRPSSSSTTSATTTSTTSTTRRASPTSPGSSPASSMRSSTATS